MKNIMEMTFLEELEAVGEIRNGFAVLRKDENGYYMRDSRSIFSPWRHDLSLDSSEDRVIKHWEGFVESINWKGGRGK